MARKELVHDLNGYVFMGDEHDIVVPYSSRQEVYDWAGQNRITIEYQGTLGGLDVWRVKDDQHRVWFALRWWQ